MHTKEFKISLDLGLERIKKLSFKIWSWNFKFKWFQVLIHTYKGVDGDGIREFRILSIVLCTCLIFYVGA